VPPSGVPESDAPRDAVLDRRAVREGFVASLALLG